MDFKPESLKCKRKHMPILQDFNDWSIAWVKLKVMSYTQRPISRNAIKTKETKQLKRHYKDSIGRNPIKFKSYAKQ